METVLEWLADYSLGVVLLLAVAAVGVYLARIALDRAVSARVDLAFRDRSLRLERRSAFENRVLLDRYECFKDLIARLIAITTDLNRMRSGERPHLDPFIRGTELVPLTSVYEDCLKNRHLLGTELYDALDHASKVVSDLLVAETSDEFAELGSAWQAALSRLDAVGEEHFGLSRVRW